MGYLIWLLVGYFAFAIAMIGISAGIYWLEHKGQRQSKPQKHATRAERPRERIVVTPKPYIEPISKEEALWRANQRKANIILSRDDIIELKEYVYSIWESTDKKQSAVNLHLFIEHIVIALYPHRNTDTYCRMLLMELLQLQLSNFENYVAQRKEIDATYIFLPSTRLVKMLEEDGMLNEAIRLCDLSIQYNMEDTGYPSYEDRKAHLERKLQKKQTKTM